MIEAVGWQYFEEFFRRCSALLRDDGLMVLQAIVIDDRLYEAEKAARSFANKHVFPGGCLPSQRLIADLTANATDMRAAWIDDISAHYARTLELWRERFETAWPGLRGHGYDERFRRLWRFYLASSEAGFRERRIRDLQLALAKPGWRGDEQAARGGGEDAMKTPLFAGLSSIGPYRLGTVLAPPARQRYGGAALPGCGRSTTALNLS